MTEKNFADVASVLLCEAGKLNRPDDINHLIREMKATMALVKSMLDDLERLYIRSLDQEEYFAVMACDAPIDDEDIGDAEEYVQRKVGDF